MLKREVDKCSCRFPHVLVASFLADSPRSDLLRASPTGDWTNKGKFPPHLRPIVLEVAKTAIQTECFTPPFFDRMPAIFPYNKYTITVRHHLALFFKSSELVKLTSPLPFLAETYQERGEPIPDPVPGRQASVAHRGVPEGGRCGQGGEDCGSRAGRRCVG